MNTRQRFYFPFSEQIQSFRVQLQKKSPKFHISFQIKRVGIYVMKYETAQIYFLGEVFTTNTALQCGINVAAMRNNVTTMLQRRIALKIVVENRPV